MASATELEKLVVRLLGDASDYVKTLDEAEADTKAACQAIQRAADMAIKAQNTALQEAARVTASVALPTEVYKQKVKELDKMLKDGHISQQTYNRAFDEYEKMLPGVTAKQDKMNKELAEANALTAQVSTTEEKHKQQLAGIENLLKKGYITQQTYNRAIKEAKMELDRANPALQRAKEITESIRTPAQKYAIQLKELNTLHRAGHITTQTYGAAVKQLGAQYSTVAAKMQLASQIGSKVQGNLQAMSGMMTGAGTKMTMGVTAPVVGGAAFSLHEFSKYQDGLNNIKAAAKPTEAELKMLDDAAMQLSKDLKMDPTAILSTFNELLKAGMSVDKVLQGSGKSAAQFAKVGELETATAAVIMADAQKMFGEESARTADILSSAADASSTSIRGIAEAFGQTSAVAKMADQNLTDTAASIAILASNGIKGSDAGTSLKTMFIALAAPTKHAQDVIDKYGLSLRTSSGQIKPMADLIGELKNKLGGLNDEAQDSALKHLLGTDALRAGTIFLGEGAEGFREVVKEMQEANTVAEKYDIIMKGVSASTAGLWAAVKRLAITLGGPLGDAYTSIIGWIASVIDKTTEWLEANPEMIKVVGIVAAIAAAIGPLLIAGGSLVGMFAAAVGGITVFLAVGWEIVLMSAAIVAGLTIFALEVAAVAAAIAGLIYWIVGPDSLASAWNTAMEYAKNFFLGTLGFIMNFQHNMGVLLAWLPNHWHEVLSDIGNMAQTVWFNMMRNLGVALRTGFRLFVAWQGWLSGIFTRVFSIDFLKAVGSGIVKVIEIFANFSEQAWKHLKGIFTGKKVGFGDFIEQMNKDFSAGAENLNFLDTAQGILNEEFNNLHNPLEGFESSISEGPALVFDIGKKTGEAYVEGIEEATEQGMAALDESVFFGPVQEVAEMTIKELRKARSGVGGGGKAGKDEGVFFEPEKVHKEAKAVKKLKDEIQAVVGLGGIQGAEAGTVEALSRVADYFALRKVDAAVAGPDAGLVGLEPKTVGGKIKAFAEGDLKAVAGIEKFNAGDSPQDKLLDTMADAVREIKIGNDLMRDDDSFSVTLEPANLGIGG